MRALLAVDGPLLLYRAYFALPSTITGAAGRPVNALLGATNAIMREVEGHDPRAVVVCFGPDAAAYRVDLYPAYHAHREPAPADLAEQFAACPRLFGSLGWTVADHPSLEADDLLGSYATVETGAGGRALLLTGDRDMFQCAAGRVTVLYLGRRGAGAERVGPAEVRDRYGVEPGQVPDFIALRGDPSDGLPGARGVGPKTAAELLRRHGTLERVLEAAPSEPRRKLRSALLGASEELLAFKQIATLRDAGVARPADRETDRGAGAAVAAEMGMDRLCERLRAGPGSFSRPRG
ncbi:MAG: 5'-3' exonuclease [Solirubrobacterales bacterium]